MRARSFVVVVVAACGSGASRPAPVGQVANAAPPDAAVVVAPPYQALFEAGRRWTFAIERKEGRWDPHDPDANREGYVVDDLQAQASCLVVEVVEHPGGWLAEVYCDFEWPAGAGRVPLAAVWATDAQGLYRLDDWPADRSAPELTDDLRILSEIAAAGACWRRDWVDDTAASWASICVDEQGFASGSYGWSADVDHAADFRRIALEPAR